MKAFYASFMSFMPKASVQWNYIPFSIATSANVMPISLRVQ